MRLPSTRLAEYSAMLAIWLVLVVLFGALADNFLSVATFAGLANRIPALAIVAAGHDAGDHLRRDRSVGRLRPRPLRGGPGHRTRRLASADVGRDLLGARDGPRGGQRQRAGDGLVWRALVHCHARHARDRARPRLPDDPVANAIHRERGRRPVGAHRGAGGVVGCSSSRSWSSPRPRSFSRAPSSAVTSSPSARTNPRCGSRASIPDRPGSRCSRRSAR